MARILITNDDGVFSSGIKLLAEELATRAGIGLTKRYGDRTVLDRLTFEVLAGFFNNFIAASVLMFGLVMAFNMFSDALQDALDPKKVAES